jgi:hypothetical protein
MFPASGSDSEASVESSSSSNDLKACKLAAVFIVAFHFGSRKDASSVMVYLLFVVLVVKRAVQRLR